MVCIKCKINSAENKSFRLPEKLKTLFVSEQDFFRLPENEVLTKSKLSFCEQSEAKTKF